MGSSSGAISAVIHRFLAWRRLRAIKRDLAKHGWEPYGLTGAEWRFLETEDPDLFSNLKSVLGDRG